MLDEVGHLCWGIAVLWPYSELFWATDACALVTSIAALDFHSAFLTPHASTCFGDSRCQPWYQLN